MFDSELANRHKSNPKDFTRSRKLSFAGTIVFMMNMIRKSLAVEIEKFVSLLNRESNLFTPEIFTKSAFCQCRNKISAEVFVELSSHLVEEFYTDNDESIKLWSDYRLLAVDGSTLGLPDTKDLRSLYGTSKNQNGKGKAQGRVSVLYDVLNGFVIESKLSPLATGEITLANEHVKHTSCGDLVIYDRGYPSFNLVYEHQKAESDFLFRVKKDFSAMVKDFVLSNEESREVDMFPGQKKNLSEKEYDRNTCIRVRLIKVVLENGEDEILITSLLDTHRFPTSIFKELYFKRWRVETYYGEFKNNLEAGIFSGYSERSVQQDFNAAVFISNLQNLIVREADEELEAQGIKKKYKHKVNRNTSYGFMKGRVLSIFFSTKPSSEIMAELKELFLKNTIPIRPGRKMKREVGKYRNKEKPKNPLNSKGAI